MPPSATVDHNNVARWIANELERSAPDAPWRLEIDLSALTQRRARLLRLAAYHRPATD